MADEIPSLAELRRSRTRRLKSSKDLAPSLFDAEGAPDAILVKARPVEQGEERDVGGGASAERTGRSDREHMAPLPVVFTVGELVRQVRNLVERAHNHIMVEGEISNWRPASSGHVYFTLKDAEAQLSIVLFRRQAVLLRFRPKDGDSVRVSGALSVYESRGQLQLVAETMQQTGLGAVLAATQALKERLRREGLFANERPLPAFPRCIGVVTSLHGAALRDIIKVCRRRHAAVDLLIYPVAVQGPNCAAEVAAGVRWFSRHAEMAAQAVDPALVLGGMRAQEGVVDVILVARGGGSWEDLHGFDDESVARAIAASFVPVITGIGHATDTTIADAAADQHAPTPSAAAELLTAGHYGLADRLMRLGARLARSCHYNLLRLRQSVSALNADAILRRTRSSLERRSQRLDDLTDRAEVSIDKSLRQHLGHLQQLEARIRRQHVSLNVARKRQSLQSMEQRLRVAGAGVPGVAGNRLDRSVARLEALSPFRVLERGYALVYGPDGEVLRDASWVGAGTMITAQLARGRLHAKVTERE
ncbi:MAG: exodeoxyribonuclease VII large subunit [Acidobacteriaceae bacterium]